MDRDVEVVGALLKVIDPGMSSDDVQKLKEKPIQETEERRGNNLEKKPQA